MRLSASRSVPYNSGMTTAANHFPSAKALDPSRRLALIVDTMREISLQTDPQVINRIYSSAHAAADADRTVCVLEPP